MGLLPMGADILPPSDDRVFKLILTDPKAKPGLIKLISAIIGRNVVDVTLYPNEPPAGSVYEKAERLDINCKIDDGSQVNLEMQATRLQEDADGHTVATPSMAAMNGGRSDSRRPCLSNFYAVHPRPLADVWPAFPNLLAIRHRFYS